MFTGIVEEKGLVRCDGRDDEPEFPRFTAKPGSRVNLERAMPADGRFGGHIVAGHVDGTGTIVKIEKDETAVWYRIEAAPEVLR